MENIPLIDPPMQSTTLVDGRQLTWQEFGRPDGKPVLYFHGGGSFSLEAGIFHREAVQKNIRLIATNRPGVGGSTLCPGRPVAAYSNDLNELLDLLKIETFACTGESNGGMVTLAAAAGMAPRILGAVPVNPTVPWFDPQARRVSPSSVGLAYRLMKYMPGAIAKMAAGSTERSRRQKAEAEQNRNGFHPMNLIGPPPGTEEDIADFQWRVMEHFDKRGLLAELKWAASDWGFDYYSIPVPLDFFCGAHDSQAPFALMLADRNPNARFHYFSFGHSAFSHPDARLRMMGILSSYFEL